MSTFAKALRIDPGPAWDSLPPDAQRALGIAAITTIVSEQAYEAFERHSDDIVPAAIEQALEVGQDEMGNIFLEHFSVRMDSTKTLVIDTAAIGFPSCHQCGCTEAHACVDGCTWIDDTRTLCTACAPLRCEPANA